VRFAKVEHRPANLDLGHYPYLPRAISAEADAALRTLRLAANWPGFAPALAGFYFGVDRAANKKGLGMKGMLRRSEGRS
jgi:hypothetical protein